MALKSPVVGLKWARLEIIGIEWEERAAELKPWDDGAVLDPPEMEPVCTLLCTCGNKVVRDASDIDKRVMKTCGKCVENDTRIDDSGRVRGIRPGRPAGSRGRGIGVTLYLPIPMLNQLRDMAEKQATTLSAVTVELLAAVLEG